MFRLDIRDFVFLAHAEHTPNKIKSMHLISRAHSLTIITVSTVCAHAQHALKGTVPRDFSLAPEYGIPLIMLVAYFCHSR